MLSLETGTLWPLTVQRTRAALRCGALQPIVTVSEQVEQAGVEFIVRMVSSLRRKKQQPRSGNPFLPFDDALFVTDMSDTHVCLLNKFPVIEHHLLFVTREFEDQELPLSHDDFAVAATALREIDGLAFYNSGVGAGASQAHRHLQLIRLPLSPDERLPMEALIRLALNDAEDRQTLPFRHAVAQVPRRWLEDDVGAAPAMRACYVELLRAAGVIAHGLPDESKPLPPYNWLMTREWMLLVPRSRGRWKGISVNALGFGGSLFVREPGELRAVKTHGPMNVLRGVVPE